MIQLIMRITGGETDSSKEVEYTDWDQVTAFARDFAVLAGKNAPQRLQENGFAEK